MLLKAATVLSAKMEYHFDWTGVMELAGTGACMDKDDGEYNIIIKPFHAIYRRSGYFRR